MAESPLMVDSGEGWRPELLTGESAPQALVAVKVHQVLFHFTLRSHFQLKGKKCAGAVLNASLVGIQERGKYKNVYFGRYKISCLTLKNLRKSLFFSFCQLKTWFFIYFFLSLKSHTRINFCIAEYLEKAANYRE